MNVEQKDLNLWRGFMETLRQQMLAAHPHLVLHLREHVFQAGFDDAHSHSGDVNAELLTNLQRHGQGVCFVPPSWGYPACPNCSGGELVEVRTNEGLTRVLCHSAFAGQGCDYIAPGREIAA